MFRLIPVALLLIAPAVVAQDKGKPVAAAEQPAKGETPQRIRNVLLFGQDKCPPPTSPDEIVVCAQGGESPYRIPKDLRERPERPGEQSWAQRAALVEEVNRAGLPNSCSPIGTGGQTGCTAAMLRAWAREQIDKKAAQAKVP